MRAERGADSTADPTADRSRRASGPLPRADYEDIFGRVPRLTVEVVIVSPQGVLLTLRRRGPCAGLWHIPGGTVRYGEPLGDAVARVARDELDVDAAAGRLLGYIEYPSHLARGIDWPVGIAFAADVAPEDRDKLAAMPGAGWFRDLPPEMHEEQRAFLVDVAAGRDGPPAGHASG
jgi:ADP-ribose pyrophosphatase YjhB (NUDIX family)